MSMRASRRWTRRSAERALDGHTSGREGSAVDAVLAAASRETPSGTELSREAEAVAMFAASRAISADTVEGLTMIQMTRRRLATAKVGIATTAAILLTGGGVAYAATSGSLPSPLGQDHRSESGAKHSAAAPGKAKDKTATPHPSLTGLCHAFQSGATSHGKALQSPAFKALVTAAGGTENVPAYCITLVGAPTPKPTDDATDDPADETTDGTTAEGTEAPKVHPTHPAHPVHPTHPAKPTKTPKAPNPHKPTAKPTKAPKTPKPDKPAKAEKAPNPHKPVKAPKTANPHKPA